MYQNLLIQLGLSTNEAILYELLLQLGSSPAADLIHKAKIKKSNTYALLESLKKKGLVLEQKSKQMKKTIFTPLPPEKLNQLVKEKEQQLATLRQNLNKALPQLNSQYILSTEKPIITYHEGIDGIKHIYNDILVSKKNVRIVRAAYEPSYLKIFHQWIKQYYVPRRVKNKQNATLLSPDEPGANRNMALDKKWRIMRQWVNLSDYNTPVEINIYNNKVAIISFKKDMVGVIIENSQIARAFQQLYDLATEGAANKYHDPNTTD